MERLFSLLVIVFYHQIALCQVNLNIDINARQLTSMKLSDISAESRFVALKMDSIRCIVTDKYLFVAGGRFKGVNQFDMTGKLIKKFNTDNERFLFRCDSKNNRLIFIYGNEGNELAFWDFNGNFIKKIVLPVVQEKSTVRDIIGFDKDCIWISYQIWKKQSEKAVIRIYRLNIENERQDTVLEREFPIPQLPFFYKVWYSSFGGNSYLGFHDNIIYEFDGKNIHPAVKYNIHNYRDEQSYMMHYSLFAGRYLTIRYGSSMSNCMLFWYDTKDKRTWQIKIKDWNGNGGIEDDIFYTGTCDNYWFNDDFLVFRKKSNELPKEMNIEKEHTVFFITKLKQ